MKSLKIILMLCAVCLMWTGCQDNEEPVNRVPSVTTGEAKPSSREATLYGTWNSLFGNPNNMDLYFLYSTNPDLSDAQEVWAYKEYPSCWANIKELQPNTTYYYALVCYADRNVDNPVSVRGEIKSFTTSEGVDVLKTYEADVNTTYSAVLYGLYKGDLTEPEFYFKVSLTQDMSDAFTVIAEPIDEYVEGTQVYRAVAYDLQPKTTYYYAFCVKSGMKEIVANKLNFTTKSSLYINRVTLTDWDGKEVDFPMDQFGCTFKSPDGSTYYNMEITGNGDYWKMEKDLLAVNGMWQANAYASYVEQYQKDASGEYYIRKQIYKYGGFYDNQLLTCSSETEEGQFYFGFSYYNPRVRFHFSIPENTTIDIVRAEGLLISNGDKVLNTIVNYYLNTGTISYQSDGFEFPFSYYTKFEFDRWADAPTDVIIYAFPTCSKGEVVLTLQTQFGNLTAPFTIDWKSGKTYDYNVVVELLNDTPTMTIEDVTKY